MASARAPKRRRLNEDKDNLPKTSPAAVADRSAGKTPITYSFKQSRPSDSSPALDGSAIARSRTANDTRSGQSTVSAKEIWREIQDGKKKLRAIAKEGKQSETLDVYDDIDGAHNVGSVFMQRPVQKKAGNAKPVPEKTLGSVRTKTMAATERPASTLGASSPALKVLDPLKNQRQVASSPQKPSLGARAVGLFKQLTKHQQPPVPDARNTYHAKPRSNVKVTLQDALNGGDQDTSESESDGEDGARQESKESEPPIQGNGKRSVVKPSFEYTTAKPKTFEDEIRELEQKAREAAAQEDSEDELVSKGDAHTPTRKQPSTKKHSTRPNRELAIVESPIARARKPLDKRKAKKMPAKDDLGVPESDDEARMDVDEDDEDATSIKLGRPNPRVAIRQGAFTPQKLKAQPPKTSVKKPGVPFDSDDLECIRGFLLARATGKRAIPLANLADEYAKVSNLVAQTVTAGESNSMLLIGARGSAKSTLINQVLHEQKAKHPDDFHVVRLNGFVHTDDKIALREIWRQLGREMELDEQDKLSKNYADTMTRLLALLSHPGEMEMKPDQISKSVIFILNEFDLFATHPRQTLLYNLFDIAQSRKAPIAVLGLTTRIDVAESLEKRVKSRFSHRFVHLSMAKTLPAFEQICRNALSVSAEELASEDKTHVIPTEASISTWNATVDDILKSDACSTFVGRLFYTTKSVPEFQASTILALATMTTTSTDSNAVLEHFENSLSHSPLLPPDSKLSILSSLSTLQLALLVCAARLTNIYNTDIISFALAYEEYKVLASKAKLQASASGAIAQSKVWGKAVAKDAWQELVECGLVMEEGRTSGSGRVDVGLEELGMSGADLGGWGKWCREI